MNPSPEVSIIIPNYKTPDLTKLCLRSLRKYTDFSRAKVIAVDNDSGDASLEYLRSLKWITLLERNPAGETGPQMHAKALDYAVAKVDTPFVLVIHTDTIVKDPRYLDFLLERIKADPEIAAVGSWKLEYVPPLKIFFKKIETFFRKLAGRKILDRSHYFRSHCALYKTDLLKETKGFADGDSAGISVFNMLREKGYKLPFIQSEDLCRYMTHLNHATMILNPVSGSSKTSKPSSRRNLDRKIRDLHVEELLQNESLDK
ncbi:MAG: glycosyltransferase [Lentisphaeria bacterium]|nr:glycosyltransferase [Lentisphaeria bacterium]